MIEIEGFCLFKICSVCSVILSCLLIICMSLLYFRSACFAWYFLLHPLRENAESISTSRAPSRKVLLSSWNHSLTIFWLSPSPLLWRYYLFPESFKLSVLFCSNINDFNPLAYAPSPDISDLREVSRGYRPFYLFCNYDLAKVSFRRSSDRVLDRAIMVDESGRTSMSLP